MSFRRNVWMMLIERFKHTLTKSQPFRINFKQRVVLNTKKLIKK